MSLLSQEKRQRARSYIAAHPDLSYEQISRDLGIHVSSVKRFGRGLRSRPADIQQIRQRLRGEELLTSIAKDFGVKANTIRNIKAGRTWGWVH